MRLEVLVGRLDQRADRLLRRDWRLVVDPARLDDADAVGGVGEQLAVVDGVVEDQLQHRDGAAGQMLGPPVQQQPVAELVDMAAGEVGDQLVSDPDLGILDVQPHVVAVAAQRRALHPPPGFAPHLAMVEPALRGLGHRDAFAVGQIGVVGDQRADLHQIDVGVLPAREQLRAAFARLVGEIHLPAHQARGQCSLPDRGHLRPPTLHHALGRGTGKSRISEADEYH